MVTATGESDCWLEGKSGGEDGGGDEVRVRVRVRVRRRDESLYTTIMGDMGVKVMVRVWMPCRCQFVSRVSARVG